jgi:hypothetical protein
MKSFLKKILNYLYNSITGNFLGFLIGTAATGLMSHYFTTKSIRNLWGLTAKKKVLDKDTYSNLEWIISIVIGFIVFEIVTKVIKKKFDEKLPIYKVRFMQWMIRNKIHFKTRKTKILLNEKSVAMYSSMHAGTQSAIDGNSK